MPQLTIEQVFQTAIQYHQSGQLSQAENLYRQILAQQSKHVGALHYLGVIAHQVGRFDSAVDLIRQALALQPDYADAYTSLGTALKEKGLPDEAIAAHKQAIALKPNFPEAYNNLGVTLKAAGQLDEAISAYRQAINLKPQLHGAHSNLVYAAHFHPAYDANALAQELSHWNRQHAEPLTGSIQPHSQDRDPDRRLRVGYVSPDFCIQAESHFVVPLLATHDHQGFEIHCYSSVTHPDEITDRLRRDADRWHDVLHFSDAGVAEQIRRDGIDILVDLTMHMAKNRLLIFAHKPAPVQFTWLAYPGSTGLHTIDYRITDGYMDPLGLFDACYSEKSVRLADCWCCYDPLIQVEFRTARQPGPIRFGSLNNPCKLNQATLQSWIEILMAVPNSRLLLLADSQGQRAQIRRLFEQAGVAGERVQFASRLSRLAYLQLYDDIDIGLDTLPYNGITTTCDALWMGVPVVSVCGRTAAGRAGLSILSTVGLPELVAPSSEMYVRLAINLACDLPRLANLRSTLRQRMEQSPLMNADRFARNIEGAYRQAWRTWCATSPPQS